MTDRELVEKRLAHVVTCVEDLRRLAETDRIATDPRDLAPFVASVRAKL